MRPVGFSSGSLAGDDAARAVAISLDLGLPAIELSALRLPSLEPLVALVDAKGRLVESNISIRDLDREIERLKKSKD